MTNMKMILKGSIVLAATILSAACVIAEPREGYYDHDHGRYYHEHAWHDCGERSDACR